MPAVHETAYPRLKHSISNEELHESYTPAASVRAETREDISDLINAAIEELIRHRYELPAYRTLLDAASRIRTEVNRRYFRSVSQLLGEEGPPKGR